jgi:hypothetical protein
MPAFIGFQPGDKVRVRRGITDVEYSDIPFGGWAGVITEVDGDMCTVKWTKETLASIHPDYRNRCERDGSDFEVYCIEPDELEPDPGGPLDIEQPTRIIARSLSPSNQDDRIRMVFGLTSDDLVPEVNDGSLETYYKYLSKHLVFPFAAKCRVGYGRPQRVQLIGLVPMDEDAPSIDESYGFFCAASFKGDVVTLPLTLQWYCIHFVVVFPDSLLIGVSRWQIWGQPAAVLGVTRQTRDGRWQPSSGPRRFSQRLDDVAAVGQLRILAILQGRLQHSPNASQILETLIDFRQPVLDE